jgi:hypothetical protein
MNCLPQSLHLYICLEPLRPFFTTFEEPQKKHFFYHIINNIVQRYENQIIEGYLILLFVHPAYFIDYAANHPEVTLDEYEKIQEVIEDYDDIKELKRRVSQVSTGHDSPLNATSFASKGKLV